MSEVPLEGSGFRAQTGPEALSASPLFGLAVQGRVRPRDARWSMVRRRGEGAAASSIPVCTPLYRHSCGGVSSRAGERRTCGPGPRFLHVRPPGGGDAAHLGKPGHAIFGPLPRFLAFEMKPSKMVKLSLTTIFGRYRRYIRC